MKAIQICFFFCLFSLIGFSQKIDITKPEIVYFYHTVKKSPIMDDVMGRLFQINQENQDLAYLDTDSLEQIFLKDSSKLLIHKEEFLKVSRGLYFELLNKTAVWDFNSMMDHISNKTKDSANYQLKFAFYLEKLNSKLPNSLKTNDKLDLKIKSLLNPNLYLNDRVKLINSYSDLSEHEKLMIFEAIDFAFNEYIDERILSYNAFFGLKSVFKNFNISAGDGNNTNEEFTNREKDEKNKFNMALPYATGHFPYTYRKNITDNEKTLSLNIEQFPIFDFQNLGYNYNTSVHVDVWEYSPETQATIIIQKNGLSYHLFSDGQSRFLSPDSTFKKKGTFQGIINNLKQDIKGLEEMIYGKKGFDYWIEFYDNERKKISKAINSSSMGIDKYRSEKVTTNAPKKVTTKTQSGKKKTEYVMTHESNQKKRVPTQHLHIFQNEELARIKAKIKELKQQKEEALELLQTYNDRLGKYSELIGTRWAKYKFKNGVYTFEDSTIFIYNQQDFVFKSNANDEPFVVKVLSIPKESRTTPSTEFKTHFTVYPTIPNYDAILHYFVQDEFEVDNWILEKNLYTEKDSVEFKIFCNELLNTKKKIILNIEANGVGTWNGCRVITSADQSLTNDYPGETEEERTQAFENIPYKDLRLTEVIGKIDDKITINIRTFTDNVDKGEINVNKQVKAKMTKANLSSNQMLTIYQAKTVTEKLFEDLTHFIMNHYEQKDTLILNKKLTTLRKSSKIKANKTFFSLNEL